jgi:hypothetical protein
MDRVGAGVVCRVLRVLRVLRPLWPPAVPLDAHLCPTSGVKAQRLPTTRAIPFKEESTWLCHPFTSFRASSERSEGSAQRSISVRTEMLRCAQHDNPFSAPLTCNTSSLMRAARSSSVNFTIYSFLGIGPSVFPWDLTLFFLLCQILSGCPTAVGYPDATKVVVQPPIS